MSAADEVRARLEAANRILLTGHQRTDGDCVGSLIALSAVLGALGKEIHIVLPDPPPERYRKLAGFDRLGHYQDRPLAPVDLVVALDSAGRDRLGALASALPEGAPVINLDHHASNTGWGDLVWVASDASSVGEMIWRLVTSAGWPLPPEAAEGLYVAILTDTGRFMHPNTTAASLEAAARLVEAGADAPRLARLLFEERREKEVRLLARALASLALFENGRVARVTLTARDFAELDATPVDTHEVVDWPRSIRGVEIAAYLYELDNGARTRVSLRSVPPLDVCYVAAQFGGGGHAGAAACTLAGSAEEVWTKVEPVIFGRLA